ncbi:MAG TPA: hypothetical protein DHV64_07525 [Erythrobacter sp.]|nr:hypothetical protein [Erythrobacter sp.]|tara:strand:+ start:86 stop:376 length:291 start_codon:yes stop_codon:yes gene_type:complete
MSKGSPFDQLMHEVCVERGWCGGIVDEKPRHVTDFLPESGVVSADQFALWLFEAEGVDPDEDRSKWQPHLDGLKAAFVRHLGEPQVAVSELKWSDS